jgi:cation diffusion facilitator family transporter
MSQPTGVRTALLSMGASILLAAVKIAAGWLGRSYALVADGIESLMDVVSSAVVLSGLHWASKPPDSNHPYGHGKAESLAALFVAIVLMAAAIGLAIQSVHAILNPQQAPEPWTLLILILVVGVKEVLFRHIKSVGKKLKSSSLKSDAWHHRSDAITSLAAFIGISIALVGGDGYESADAWAALFACAIIFYNGFRLIRPALDEVMDAAVPQTTEIELRKIAADVPEVVRIEKCRIRKSGTGLMMDLHVVVHAQISVRQGHAIGHVVKDRLLESPIGVRDVIVHIEPDSH